MYQGGSDRFLAPAEAIRAADEAWGIDFEAEVAVVTDDVPMGVSASDAAGHIKLVMLVNDVSLRGRSEEHTSELQSLMRISYAVFCLKKKNKKEYTREMMKYK